MWDNAQHAVNRKFGAKYFLFDDERIAEDMQIAHYDVGEQYMEHCDFSYPRTNEQTQTRSIINLCMYLNNAIAGGETSFPKMAQWW